MKHMCMVSVWCVVGFVCIFMYVADVFFSDFLHCTLGRHRFCHLALHQHDFWVTSTHTRTLYMCVTRLSYRLMTNAYMLSEKIDGGCTHIYILYTYISTMNDCQFTHVQEHIDDHCTCVSKHIDA